MSLTFLYYCVAFVLISYSSSGCSSGSESDESSSRLKPSLIQLADDIAFTYNSLSDLFPGLTPEGRGSRDSEKHLGRYIHPVSVCHLLLQEKSSVLSQITMEIDVPDICFLSVSVQHKRTTFVVLTALGRMLNQHFLNDESLSSMAMSDRNSYYRTVCARGKVFMLSKFDLTNSIITINQESLLCKLSLIVKDVAIMELVRKFLSISFVDITGREVIVDNRFSIPPSLRTSNISLTQCCYYRLR
jgi:hypothetical protein